MTGAHGRDGARLGIILGLGILLAVLGAAGVFGLPKLNSFRARFSAVEADVAAMRIELAIMRMQADGYRVTIPSELPLRTRSPADGGMIVFAGHIYPRNYLRSASSPDQPPLELLSDFVHGTQPDYVVLGGDNVVVPSDTELRKLDRLIDRWETPVRLVMGNHEDYWNARGDTLFDRLFEPRYGFSDHMGVRMIWLHTDLGDGRYGLDTPQTIFLDSALTGDYRYALVFLHHALWAGNTIFANTFYPRGEELARMWTHSIAPQLRRGKVKGVFSGDGGWRHQGAVSHLSGIPHFVTGWPGTRSDIFPEWLAIYLLNDGINVTSYRAVGEGHLLSKGEVVRR